MESSLTAVHSDPSYGHYGMTLNLKVISAIKFSFFLMTFHSPQIPEEKRLPGLDNGRARLLKQCRVRTQKAGEPQQKARLPSNVFDFSVPGSDGHAASRIVSQ
jgi:hypothetical protein